MQASYSEVVKMNSDKPLKPSIIKFKQNAKNAQLSAYSLAQGGKIIKLKKKACTQTVDKKDSVANVPRESLGSFKKEKSALNSSISPREYGRVLEKYLKKKSRQSKLKGYRNYSHDAHKVKLLNMFNLLTLGV